MQFKNLRKILWFRKFRTSKKQLNSFSTRTFENITAGLRSKSESNSKSQLFLFFQPLMQCLWKFSKRLLGWNVETFNNIYSDCAVNCFEEIYAGFVLREIREIVTN